MMSDEITQLFTRESGDFVFARWGRPVAPVIFGVADESLTVLKGALEAVLTIAGHEMAETDPELGANLMMFFVRDWRELADTPNLDRLVPDLSDLLVRLQAVDANQYRIFRFDGAGGIKAAFVFVRMDEAMVSVPAEVLALGQMVQTVLLWSDRAFQNRSPLGVTENGLTVLRPEVANLVRAAYDPVLPVASDDPAFALRLSARIKATS
ncbi:MAG: hypothetical protein AAF667_19925 [Pseudomonadota bacterium]